MKITRMKTALIALVWTLILSSCGAFSDDANYAEFEFDKNFEGATWAVEKAERNGVDITTFMDFSKFRISFNDDKTYSIKEYLPFLVREDGVWEIDDPQYPFHLIFQEKGKETKLDSELNYFIEKGVRKLTLTFSPGHPNNVYTYTFKKIADDF